MSIHEIEARALRLPRHERAELARMLLASLDEADEVAEAWAEEAQRRYKALRSGEVEAEPAADVFSKARAALR